MIYPVNSLQAKAKTETSEVDITPSSHSYELLGKVSSKKHTAHDQCISSKGMAGLHIKIVSSNFQSPRLK
jgi:hypothetical protein